MAGSTVARAYREYRTALAEYEALRARKEGTTRFAFQSLLDDVGRSRGLTLLAERTIHLPGGGFVVVDGELVDHFSVRRGVWEAKPPGTDLGRALEEKLGTGYPDENFLLENTAEALLLQDGEVRGTFSLEDEGETEAVLLRFTGYRPRQMDRFEVAAAEFQRHLPHLAAELGRVVAGQKHANPRFRAALDELLSLCRSSINPATRMEQVEDMLRQHLLAERIFRSVFRNPDFVARNPVARQVQRVVAELTGPHFSSVELFYGCEEFYRALEAAAATIAAYEDKQQFLHTVYERFFQGVSTATADTHGIVYTPDEIVRWMVRSVEWALDRHLGRRLGEPGLGVLDPCTGTGKFLVELLRRVDVPNLDHTYRNDLFANEVLLLPYYIAAQNAEWEHYSRVGAYEPFPGICFADTLDMEEGKQMDAFDLENAARMLREETAEISVVVGNPPYNVGQQNENDNNRNRGYGEVDARIRATYARGSAASSSARLYDMYVRFFRWATDRLRGRPGIVCLVTNSSFLDQVAFDGMRRELLREFSEVSVLDLGGNVRRNPRLSGTRHNVFGIQVGVAVTLLVRRPGWTEGERGVLRYARVGEYWTRLEKLRYLRERVHCGGIDWEDLTPDARHNWLNAGIAPGWEEMLPLGSKSGKRRSAGSEGALFRTFTLGVNTNRDAWVYGHSREAVLERVRRLVDTYNGDLGRWRAARGRGDLDALVTADETRIKWSSRLKEYLKRGVEGEVEPERMRRALYRPFCARHLYFAPLLIHRPGLFDRIYPTPEAEEENLTLCVTDAGSEKPFMALATRGITDLHLAGAGAGTQCFPLYVYDADGRRVENVDPAALAAFRERHGAEVGAAALFHYVYALLHAPGYRERYAANLRRSLPRVPLGAPDAFAALVEAGRRLVRLHARFDEAEPYPLEEVSTALPHGYRVERMRLADHGETLVVNRAVTLRGIPPEASEYRVGARTALEWVVDQHRVRSDRRSGIADDPNDPENPRAIVDLVARVVRVSVETVRIVESLPEVAGAEGNEESSA
jgi:predicted helicase